MANKKNNIIDAEFEYVDSSGVDHQITITQDDFEQIQLDKTIHDVKFETKPTTYLKDAMRRFVKNKSSVIGACILGVIVLLAVFVPIFSSSDISRSNLNETFLYPKLFPSGTGFWDGTITYDTGLPYDTVNETPAGFNKNAVSNLVTWEDTIDTANEYASGGYLRFVASRNTRGAEVTRTLESYYFTYDEVSDYTIELELSEIYADSDSYELAEYNFYLYYYDNDGEEHYVYYYDNYQSTYGTITIDLDEFIEDEVDPDYWDTDLVFGIEIPCSDEYHEELYIPYISMICSDEDSTFNDMGFTDANAQVLLSQKDSDSNYNINYWSCTGYKNLYGASITYCTFTYDSYEAAFGEGTTTITWTEMLTYISNGWISLDTELVGNLPNTNTFDEDVAEIIATFEILDEENCPIIEINSITVQRGAVITYSFSCTVTLYKYYGYSSMPSYLFGTDYLGRDLFNLMFTGLRTSLLLGLCVTIINMIVGIVWGAISGYFGGWVDLTMERITDILGRVPWLVIMTICILYFGQNFFTFALALCLTGWIGIASTTRAQFYRFKGREYVLASRTLGASDFRLIFKHILPNSLGTLVTSFVFLIPSVIFDEASISYLGLGLSGSTSFGVILSDNQKYISSYSYLILIPSIFMALLMVSFNLFGNGLRDAFNPSLKGSD